MRIRHGRHKAAAAAAAAAAAVGAAAVGAVGAIVALAGAALARLAQHLDDARERLQRAWHCPITVLILVLVLALVLVPVLVLVLVLVGALRLVLVVLVVLVVLGVMRAPHAIVDHCARATDAGRGTALAIDLAALGVRRRLRGVDRGGGGLVGATFVSELVAVAVGNADDEAEAGLPHVVRHLCRLAQLLICCHQDRVALIIRVGEVHDVLAVAQGKALRRGAAQVRKGRQPLDGHAAHLVAERQLDALDGHG